MRLTHRLRASAEQLAFLAHEVRKLVHGRWWRWYTVWFGASAWAVAAYRVDRSLFLLCGDAWALLRPLFFPVFLVCRVLGDRCEIHYRAQIGRGLLILHPTLGVVVSGHAVIGANLVLTGGNCIGLRAPAGTGALHMGNDVSLGANAVVLGPLRVGNNVRIGAGAVVVSDADDDEVLVGVPARAVHPAAHDAPLRW